MGIQSRLSPAGDTSVATEGRPQQGHGDPHPACSYILTTYMGGAPALPGAGETWPVTDQLCNESVCLSLRGS